MRIELEAHVLQETRPHGRMAIALNDEQRALAERNIKLAYSYANRHIRENGVLYKLGWDFDEILMLCYEALCVTVARFEPDYGVQFSTLFWRVCDRDVIQAMRRMTRKCRFNASGVDLSCDSVYDAERGMMWVDVFADPCDGPEKAFENAERIQTLRRLIADADGRDAEAFLMHLRGMTQKQIAARMGISQSSASRAIMRTERRLRAKMLELGY